MNKNTITQVHDSKKNLINIILIASVLTTIYFSQGLQDPFNSAKMWIVFMLASYCLGFLVFEIKQKYVNKHLDLVTILVGIFITSLIPSIFFSQNKLISLIGNTQRRNGFISYFSIIIVFLAVTFYFRHSFVRQIFSTILITASGLNIYQLLQWQGKDFAKWDNPNNSIIGTLGNPNFSSALMGILTAYFVIKLIDKDMNSIIKLFVLINITLQLFLIKESGSLQGLIAALTGIFFAAHIVLRDKTKFIRLGYLILFIILSVFAIAGMLQKGPLQNFLYKPSVSIRGFYWRAALSMFREHPLFGVGLDNFGAFFQQYREVGFVLRAGFTITTTDAHNVFLNLLSTGGLVVFIPFLILILTVSVMAFLPKANSYLNDQNAIAAGWFAFISQYVISINNNGISVWGWIFAGVLVYFFYNQQEAVGHSKLNKVRSKKIIIEPLVGGLFVLVSLLLVVPLANVERNTLQSRFAFNPNSTESTNQMKSKGDLVIKSPLADSTYLNIIGVNYMSSGLANEGIEVFNIVLSKDPRNFDTLNNISLAYESLDKPQIAISYRENLMKYNPWGAPNMYQLAIDYKKIGETSKMAKLRDKILSFAESTEIGNLARTNLM